MVADSKSPALVYAGSPMGMLQGGDICSDEGIPGLLE